MNYQTILLFFFLFDFLEYGISDIPSSKAKAEMVSNVITVEFICPNDPHQLKGIKRKLLKDMEVQKVIGLAQRLFKTGGRIPTLSFVQQDVSVTFVIANVKNEFYYIFY